MKLFETLGGSIVRVHFRADLDRSTMTKCLSIVWVAKGLLLFQHPLRPKWLKAEEQ